MHLYEAPVKSFYDGSGNDGDRRFPRHDREARLHQAISAWTASGSCRCLRRRGTTTATTSPIHALLPDYGTIDDFKDFSTPRMNVDLRVIADLVMNHTSDQHPWFQEAPRNPDSSEARLLRLERRPTRYSGARIIFTDTEVSNWTWDPVARPYFWHRFFSHQPDLNYDNPAVRERCWNVMRFWLDLGVDGFRLDAVPYLYRTRRDAIARTCRRPTRSCKKFRRSTRISLTSAAGGGQSVAARRARTISAKATNATWHSTSR